MFLPILWRGFKAGLVRISAKTKLTSLVQSPPISPWKRSEMGRRNRKVHLPSQDRCFCNVPITREPAASFKIIQKSRTVFRQLHRRWQLVTICLTSGAMRSSGARQCRNLPLFPEKCDTWRDPHLPMIHEHPCNLHPVCIHRD